MSEVQVLDISLSRDLSLVESCQEFVHRLTAERKTPVIASACPGSVMLFVNQSTDGSHQDGFVMLRRHSTRRFRFFLPLSLHSRSQVNELAMSWGLNSIRHPCQADVCKEVGSEAFEHISHLSHAVSFALTPPFLTHVVVLRCFDKKLEASRDDFIEQVRRRLQVMLT